MGVRIMILMILMILEIDRRTDCDCKWKLYRNSNLFINSMVKNCDQLQTLMSW